MLTGHRKFVWNGWLLLMELDGLNDDAVLRKRTWGLDLSGLTGGASSAGLASGRSMLEGAGGIGGLLAVYDTNGTTTGENPEADDMAYVYFHDANGNVGQVCDLSHTPSDPAGAIVARYEYDPYGNVTSQSGTYAATNPFRFSTKYWDDETGLGYWGSRYYDRRLGRWISRDAVEERADENLYLYVKGDPIRFVDYLGYVALIQCYVSEYPQSKPVQCSDECCEAARHLDETMGGATHCEGGRPCMCLYPDVTKDKASDPGWGEAAIPKDSPFWGLGLRCVRQHEEFHWWWAAAHGACKAGTGDQIRGGPDGCREFDKRTWPQGTYAEQECLAHELQMQCMGKGTREYCRGKPPECKAHACLFIMQTAALCSFECGDLERCKKAADAALEAAGCLDDGSTSGVPRASDFVAVRR